MEEIEEFISGSLKFAGRLSVLGGLFYLGFALYAWIVSVEDVLPILKWPTDPSGFTDWIYQNGALPVIAFSCIWIALGLMFLSFSEAFDRKNGTN